ncbi:bifunctional 4-hydroxy-2-oxoglutarate aldolase/2-dehydro-3-deoxy-phosphogluconate aldolase [Rhodococcus sp. BP-252]|uniref:bifunctional 4-hydroxy-2-oxoglutarate aldolase/2-dehydro-3-deoxy-phosphogluconate aldolase n=1 Tax=unclassified Rhodococcus (in: high G+C Gram-positive bacteria) TaxID=192944 RepID=UPI001C9BA34C|nr:MULTISPECIES: bifunctional 4-hydroxy-2-oxoglutarate aldolase/2-dehydro-3-deoxy-phosphogluconate aldolase [unclassified Rhodococcus (in: high G+C Gram-positive bacteria)]MBY6414324.1 bifunctional 4-hydroxy-2-oxoglutarate aldolase/2-dehydro-3-deoxy-phosphogluconate aldolase [Rhodococcus sp. BP-320]MBY6419094.1 bifunctional 4-hydroxy-2-oxoglutarate aldolase/2-dehydro-3-deoxy-phosphogluconate aldolase [Rhodococcus sp. BP-321]MBY6423815.1 bifunctional 4-hydroxy-2-oxoglutarate aldolase/2-dehydro-3-
METMNSWFDQAFSPASVMAILRGFSPARTVELAQRGWDAGIACIEVPIQSPAAVAALVAVAEAAEKRGMMVGAGTVISTELVATARDSGASFTVAPGFDPVVAEASTAAGMPHLPGVATGSDLQSAAALGLGWVKAFPASVLGTEWFAAMKGPFPTMKFVATGGMNARNASDYLRAGADVVAVGSALEDETQIGLLTNLFVTR